MPDMALSSICEALIINNLKKINKILVEVVQHWKNKYQASILGSCQMGQPHGPGPCELGVREKKPIGPSSPCASPL